VGGGGVSRSLHAINQGKRKSRNHKKLGSRDAEELERKRVCRTGLRRRPLAYYILPRGHMWKNSVIEHGEGPLCAKTLNEVVEEKGGNMSFKQLCWDTIYIKSARVERGVAQPTSSLERFQQKATISGKKKRVSPARKWRIKTGSKRGKDG